MVENPTVGREYLEDADYYRLGYQLAAQLTNSEHSSERRKRTIFSAHDILFGDTGPRVADPRNRGSRADALEVAERLVGEARSMRSWYKRRDEAPWWKFSEKLEPTEKRLREFLLHTVEPCLELVIAASLRGADHREAEHRVSSLRSDAESGVLSYRALYNLACYEAGDDDEEAVNRALAYLQLGLREAPADRQRELVRWARKDPSLEKLREHRDRFDAVVNAIVAEEG